MTTENNDFNHGQLLLSEAEHNATPDLKVTQENQMKVEGWFDRIILGSIHLRGWIMLLVIALIVVGIVSYQKLPIDAVPDITNVQVQINSAAPGYTALEAEQRITYPIERVMAGIPNLELTRSISRYGLSQITIIFEDGTDIYWARQMINQRLQEAKSQLPAGIEPSMSPISTGLGEIYLWTLSTAPNAKKADGTAYTPADLRELQDWVVRPQVQRVPGVAEINTIGGFTKQYLIQPDMNALQANDLSMEDIRQALIVNNDNRGAGFIDVGGQQLTVRVPGQLTNPVTIGNVVVSHKNGIAIKVADVANVAIGHDLRTGAATMNGQETVLGTAMMMMGANSRVVSQAVDAKIQEVKRSIPKGVILSTVYNRTTLVDKAIATVQKNLIEGAILVIAVLFLFLGNIRAAIITACVIPLSMLFTLTGMVKQEISANLMSLGALDFGIIIDGAVVIVENCLRRLAEEQHRLGRLLTRQERFTQVFLAAKQARRPLIFGQLIILVVYLPIFALTGVEAKLFHPMAATVVIALVGAMILSVTFIPAAVALLITGKVEEKENRIMRTLKRWYLSALDYAYSFKAVMLSAAIAILIITGLMASKLGSEFAPTLSEGDFALQSMRSPSTSLEESLRMQERMEAALLKQFPEIDKIFARTGTAEVATDVMPPNISDGYIMLKPKSEWPDQSETLSKLRERLQEVVEHQVGAVSEFSQPIELRFNELISGVRSDVGIKIFGDDMQVLNQQAEIIAAKVRQVEGATDVKVEQTSGLPLLTVEIKPEAAAIYGLSTQQIQDTVATAIGGTVAGQILQGDRRFDLVIRQNDQMRNPEQLSQLPIRLNDGGMVALAQVADVRTTLGISQMSRENGKRRVVITANVNGRDLGSFVSSLQTAVSTVQLPAGYWVDYGGQFENLQSATKRMQIVVPVALLLVFALLIAVFNNIRDSVLVFSGVPFALTGGVVALWLRDIPFSMSAGVGFIALSGVAVLNGLVMLSFIRELRDIGLSVYQATWQGAILRLRPVLMTAFVASLGFVPMALATGTGAEVQRPLATVVIGGIISSTLLTLIFLPVVYRWLNKRGDNIQDGDDNAILDDVQISSH